jgi:aerobic-type carbon monoxide dehydrogenase small subunit (CoxS/CutS family)
MADPIQLDVNGKRYPVYSDPDTPLLSVLRDELNLTGTKYGCGEGQCGACTVLVNDSPRRSCQLPVRAAVSQHIITVEGLEKNGQLHPVQQAFLDAGAFQCAYCTSGLIMSSVALLQSAKNPSLVQIAKALQGNICRCGVHPRVIEAVSQAAKKMQSKDRVQ